ncbi:MAG: ACT domain-containing protein [Clostridia bacterium]|nr:ACT domain-containing protein [Clostridia bacterium]
MAIKQLAVFVENKHGSLDEITKILANAGVDIRALSISETQDFGILRMIVSDLEAAKATLKENQCVYTVTEVVGVSVPDTPGAMAGVIRILSENNINLEYVYAFLGASHDSACVILRVADNALTEKLLEEGGYHVVSDPFIEKL